MHRHVNYLFGKLKLLLPPAAKCIRIHIRIRNSCNIFVCLCVCAIHLFLLFVASSWQSVYAQVIPECAAADLRLQELQA